MENFIMPSDDWEKYSALEDDARIRTTLIEELFQTEKLKSKKSEVVFEEDWRNGNDESKKDQH